ASRLNAARVGASYVIDIGFSSRSPEKAARIANSVASIFISAQIEAKYQTNSMASTWLQERLQKLSEQANAAERAVLEYKEPRDIVAANGKFIDEQQVSELSSRLVSARAQTSDLLTRLSRLEQIIRDGAKLDAPVSDMLASPILTNLRQQYLDLARREAEYSA